MAFFALFGAALTAYLWATACPAKPLATFLVDQALAVGSPRVGSNPTAANGWRRFRSR